MPHYSTLSPINLSTAPDAAWNAPKPPAQLLRDVPIKLRVSGEIAGIYATSPDHDAGRPCSPGLSPGATSQFELASDNVARSGILEYDYH